MANQKQTTILAPPLHGWAQEVAVVYSREDPDNHCGRLDPKTVYLARFQLENGEFVTLLPRTVPLEQGFFDFKIIPEGTRVMHVDMEDVDDARGVAVSQSVLTAEGVLPGPNSALKPGTARARIRSALILIAALAGCTDEGPRLSVEEARECATDGFEGHPGTFSQRGNAIIYSYESMNGPANVIVTFDGL